MADNVYLLETRLSKAQQAALSTVREIARTRGLTVFLVGGAVRDLIGGTAVRDLDVAVQGNALKLRKDLEKAGGVITGDMEPGQSLFVRFPGGVRMEVGSTLTVTYPKPGKAVVRPATILDDLRRRDFTANAMALSLNEGSYGLLMDPLNGVADIENRELRLVSNYGFIEDPVRMIRATRYMARLGWGMDEKTQSRYDTGKTEGYISVLDDFHRGYETEEIFHEEDALRVIRRLEEEGWMQHLFPALSATKANLPELERLRESQAELQMQGVVADGAAASFPLLTAKLTAKEIEALKRSFPRQGFVKELEALEAKGKEFATQLAARGAALPSQSYRLITSAEPEAALWAAHTTKNAALQAKFKSFYTDWPQARQRVPHLMMQEMRITPDLSDYDSLMDEVFFQLMDGKLTTPEEMKAFLEPYSPPAPPPPVSLRRPRAPKKEAKTPKSRKKAIEAAPDEIEAAPGGAAEVRDAGASAEALSGGGAPIAAPAKIEKVAPAKIEKVVRSASPKSPPVPSKIAAKPAVAAATPAKKALTGAAGHDTGGSGGKATNKKSSGAKTAAPAASSKTQKKASARPTRKMAAKTSAPSAKKPTASKSASARKTAPAKAAKPAVKHVPTKSSKRAPVKTKTGRAAKPAATKKTGKGGTKTGAGKGSASSSKNGAAKRRR